jgi:hypothetical protein
LLRELPGANAALVVVLLAIVLFLVPVVDGRPDQPRWRVMMRWGFGLVMLGSAVYLGIRGYFG